MTKLGKPPVVTGTTADEKAGASAPVASVAAPQARVVVAIPSANRPDILPETVRAIALQDRLPDLLVLSLSDPNDIGDLDPGELPFPVQVLMGRKGAASQRNRVLEELVPGDIVLMLDDDFLMAPDYLRQMMDLFAREPEVVLATGRLLADGINGPGYNHAQGKAMLAELNVGPHPDTVDPAFSAYGCNFAIRVAAAQAHGLTFDEQLPLYSWLEDVDFSRRIAAYGKLAKSSAMRGVHLGTKTGRTPGVKLGYSQVANPVYLVRKGSMSRHHAMIKMGSNMASNLLHSLRPPAWADFRGRLRGNLIALSDVLRGRDSPGRILDLKS